MESAHGCLVYKMLFFSTMIKILGTKRVSGKESIRCNHILPKLLSASERMGRSQKNVFLVNTEGGSIHRIKTHAHQVF